MALIPVEDPQYISQEEVSEEIRICWICFGTDEDNPRLPWVQPCRCRGDGKWVHQTCLLFWVDEERRKNESAKTTCPRCKVEYIIMVPKCDALMAFVQMVDGFVYKVYSVIAAGVAFGIIFWAASSYGAFTIIQIFGEEEGLRILEYKYPFVVLVCLSLIPTTLIVMKTVRWEDQLLTFLRRGSGYPVLRYILPSVRSVACDEVMGQRVDVLPQPWGIRCSIRDIVGGLVLPTIAKIFGDVFFHTERSWLKKCIFGGLSFIAIKGVLRMYYKQKTYIQQNQPSAIRVLNHPEHSSRGTSQD